MRTELAWLSTESNKFGTDEFIDYARALGVEPYLCLNSTSCPAIFQRRTGLTDQATLAVGTGTYEEALAWVEYCNGTGNTYWANLRRKNTGRDEPHNVKLWGLGNEMHGEWQVGKLSATDYAKQAYRWAHGLKLVDPTIKLVSCGNQVRFQARFSFQERDETDSRVCLLAGKLGLGSGGVADSRRSR